MDKLKITIREVIIIVFFIGGYVVQFASMNAQLNAQSQQITLMAREFTNLQLQSASQGVKIDYISQQVNWMKERWK